MVENIGLNITSLSIILYLKKTVWLKAQNINVNMTTQSWKYSHRSWEEMLIYYPKTREDTESQKWGEVKRRPVTWSQASQNLRSHGGIGCYHKQSQVPGKDKDQSTQTKTERSARSLAWFSLNSADLCHKQLLSGDILHMDTVPT